MDCFTANRSERKDVLMLKKYSLGLKNLKKLHIWYVQQSARYGQRAKKILEATEMDFRRQAEESEYGRLWEFGTVLMMT